MCGLTGRSGKSTHAIPPGSCKRCGALSSNRVAADDNPMKPLCKPPFPLERMQELTALLDKGGQIR
ncbi:hypothetical protein [Ruminococcus sp.]|uniref:hypothetical protein n=1 Tax=Ruminococcus sp. TaxID=41978 RepID=UPI003F0720D5